MRVLFVTANAVQVVPVRRWVPDSVSWARLEDAGQIPLGQLLGPPPPPPPPASSDAANANGNMGAADKGAGCVAEGAAGEEGGGHKDQGHGVVGGKNTAGKSFRDRCPDAGRQREPLYLHDWSLPQNLGSDSSLLADRFQVCT